MKEGWKYSVVNCEIEGHVYLVLQENETSRDLKEVTVQKQVRMTFTQKQKKRNGEIEFGTDLRVAQGSLRVARLRTLKLVCEVVSSDTVELTRRTRPQSSTVSLSMGSTPYHPPVSGCARASDVEHTAGTLHPH